MKSELNPRFETLILTKLPTEYANVHSTADDLEYSSIPTKYDKFT